MEESLRILWNSKFFNDIIDENKIFINQNYFEDSLTAIPLKKLALKYFIEALCFYTENRGNIEISEIDCEEEVNKIFYKFIDSPKIQSTFFEDFSEIEEYYDSDFYDLFDVFETFPEEIKEIIKLFNISTETDNIDLQKEIFIILQDFKP